MNLKGFYFWYSTRMLIIICLGNPGEQYAKTWHNAGWIIADQIVPADAWKFNKYAQADLAEVDGVLWVKPQTFMNNSGVVVDYLRKQYGLDENNLVVVHDDLDIPLGSLKTGRNHGDAGHNGIKSIVDHFGSQDFTRIRIGIAPEGGRQSISGDFRDYVLRNMEDKDTTTLKTLLNPIQKALVSF